MANPIYKNPLAQAEAISKVPPYNKAALVSYLENFGTGDTDDFYEEWANKKGRTLTKTPLNPKFIGTDYHRQYYGADRDYTYADQYLKDDEWLQDAWQDLAEEVTDWYNESNPHHK